MSLDDRFIEFCLRLIPRFSWFSRSEQERMIKEADATSMKCGLSWLMILENLTFMRSFEYGKPGTYKKLNENG